MKIIALYCDENARADERKQTYSKVLKRQREMYNTFVYQKWENLDCLKKHTGMMMKARVLDVLKLNIYWLEQKIKEASK